MRRYLLVVCFSIAFFFLYISTQAQIISTGAPAVITTIYGTASPSTGFNVSGVNLTAGILVTPPAGFEVSTDNINFNNVVTIGNAGTVTNSPVYIRLAATTNAGTYNGNIVLISAGATAVNVTMPNSTITPAPLTIAALDVSKPYGTVLKDLTGSGFFAITAGTLKNGNTIGAVTIIYGPGYDAAAPAGTYTGSVMPSGVGGGNGFLLTNYNIVYAPANIIITKAVLTIQLNNIKKPYGNTLTNGPGYTAFTIIGLMNFETIGSITVTYIAGASATAATALYTKAIIGSAATGGTFNANNYAITYFPGDLTVIAATLTITADDKTKTYGSPNPALTFKYSGFVNNEGEAQLTGLPVIKTTALTTSLAGNYPITVSGASAANYIFIYVPGVLTISPVLIEPPIVLVLPNAFTPNNDGINDTWNLPALVPYPGCKVNIYNRYGTSVFTSIGYGKPWDGKYQGADVPTGTYYYVINANHYNVMIASGSVTVIR